MIFKKQILITLFLTFCYIGVSQAGILDGWVGPLTDTQAEKLRQYVYKECVSDELRKQGEEVEPSDHVAYQKHIRDSKCALACALETIGATVDDTQLNKELFRYVPEVKYVSDNNRLRCPNDLYEKCTHIKDTDRCEFAYKVYGCAISFCKKSGSEQR